MFESIKKKRTARKIRKQKRKVEEGQYYEFIVSKREYSWKEFPTTDRFPLIYGKTEAGQIHWDKVPPEEKINQSNRVTDLKQKAIKAMICPICGEGLKVYEFYLRNNLNNFRLRYLEYKKYYCSSKTCDYCNKVNRYDL